MMRHYELQPTVWHETALVFDWDEEAGEVSGPGADRIREMASWGEISAHPLPWSWKFGHEPLKSKTDMAAIIGWEHELPEDLAPYYPQLDDDQGAAEVLDEDGNVIDTIPLQN